jgi:hypothetical protein
MFGAVLFHVRAKDYKGLPVPVVLAVLSTSAALAAVASS